MVGWRWERCGVGDVCEAQDLGSKKTLWEECGEEEGAGEGVGIGVNTRGSGSEQDRRGTGKSAGNCRSLGKLGTGVESSPDKIKKWTIHSKGAILYNN